MSKMSRKDFFDVLIQHGGQHATEYDISKDAAFNKYSNKSLPLNVKKTRATLTPYTGVWGLKQQTHLLKRTMFGVEQSNLNTIQTMTMSQAVDAIVNAAPTVPPPPVNYYESTEPDTQGVPFGQTWVNTPYDTVGTVSYYRYLSTQAWWMNNIINQPLSIQEKMTLFWHNHFATNWDDVGENRVFYEHLKLLRANATGNFKSFVKDMTKNAMMLIYLNGQYNNKYDPDENYARELQELFTIGVGPNNYTQADVLSAAKVLTGFRLDLGTSTNYFFDDTWHDDTNKTFSSFYGNTVITGQTGPNGENELDDLLNMIFSKSVIVSRFIVRKLYRFFIHYDIDTDIETNIIVPLAQTFVTNNWNIKPVLLQLFKSSHFYETMSMDCLIRNPMDYYLGLIRTSKVSFPPASSIVDAHQAFIALFYICDYFAMRPGSPPNVAGWPAYHQSPQYHQMWINSDTLPNRMEFTDYLFTDYGVWASSSLQFRSDVIEFAKTCPTPSDPDILIDHFISRLLSFTFSAASKTYYKSILLTGMTANSVWTNAWNAYMGNPTDPILEGVVKSRLQMVLTQMGRLAEHQIS